VCGSCRRFAGIEASAMCAAKVRLERHMS